MSGEAELIQRDSAGVQKPIRRFLDSLYVSLYSLLAGEELADSKFLSQLRVTKDLKWTRCAAGTGEQVISAAPCRFMGVWVDGDAGALGLVTLRDAAATGTSNTIIKLKDPGATPDWSIHSTEAAEGARCVNGLTVQCATTGAGLTVFYRDAQFS